MNIDRATAIQSSLRLRAAKRTEGSQQRVVGERTCMVINDTELCEHEATWRVQSDKHRFDMLVCALHAKPFIGMSGCKVEPLSNDQAEARRQ